MAKQAVLGRPLQELQRAVRLVTPAEALVVLHAGAGGGDVPLVGAVDDLVHVREHDVGRVAPVRHDDLHLLQGPGAALAVGQDGAAGRCCAMAAAAKMRSSRALGPPVEPAIFMTPARCGVRLTMGPS